ncbi:MAG TPA: hypothetical protein ENN69_03540 [Spirochaetia bacterium]|nr:hypothetical protein [Spirochaetia bacterium]
MRRTLAIIFSFLFLSGALGFAGEPYLIYFENPSGGLRLIQPGNVVKAGDELVFGMTIPIGTTVVTENGDSVELQLANGSIIKIHENTNFTIISIQGENGAQKSEFDMQVGKFRAVAGKVSGDEQYTFRTRTAVCGIRGTDTGAECLVDPTTKKLLPAKIFVFDGVVDVTKLDAAGNALGSLVLRTGQWVDTGAANFSPLRMDPAMLEGFKRGLHFQKLDPRKVPGHETGTDVPPSVDTIPDTGTEDTTEAGAEEPEWVKSLREILGLQIGTVMIADETYGKVVLTPTFRAGNLTLSLYLPIIYRTNMFDPEDWYRPDGNNEWSFGTDPSFGDDWFARIGDAAYDLILKIKGLEYGRQRDPFYLKLGNLSTFTIGHGLIMRNYANDADFPSLRRIGFQLGVDTGPFGWEVVSNDLGMAFKGEPEILGSRIYFRPAYPFSLAVGLTIMADLDPAKSVPNLGDPIFFWGGLDLDFPLVESETFGLVAYGDFALMLPYFRETVPGVPSIPAGFAFDAIIHGSSGEEGFKNFGIAVGVLGNISIFEWRLEGRFSNGMFRPGFMNAIYDRVKLSYVQEVISYLQNPDDPAYTTATVGIYGEGVINIGGICSLTVGYLCPVDFTESGPAYGDNDFFQIKFQLEPHVIPVVGIFGSISYERNGFVSSFRGGLPELFDDNTVVRTTIGYPIAEGLNILFIYTTTQQRDDDTGASTLVHAFTFETVIEF